MTRFSFWSGGVANWDDVEPRRGELGHIAGSWRNLGRAAGSAGVGVTRIDVDPGKWSTPAHCHLAEEEIFFVLRGDGLLWQEEQVHEIRSGDCMVFRAAEQVHTLRAGPDGLDVLAYGTRIRVEVGELPRAGVGWLGPTWTEVGQGDWPWQREVNAGEPAVGDPQPRPDNVLNLEDVEGDFKELGAEAGSKQTGLNWERLQAGKRSCPPHCHSAEEEIFVVLDGDGTLELLPTPVPIGRGAEPEQHALRAGSVVARPAATKIAHSLVAGEGGLTYLVYGTREPNDIAYYPRSKKVYFRGIGLIARLESLEYDDGEPRDY
jgi:uncharacterized cupin superfamily protein